MVFLVTYYRRFYTLSYKTGKGGLSRGLEFPAQKEEGRYTQNEEDDAESRDVERDICVLHV